MGLLSLVFATILGSLVLAGGLIYGETRQVHDQTRAIMENGLPSVITSARMKEIIPRFRRARELYPYDLALGRDRFERAISDFEHLLRMEAQNVSRFPQEQGNLAAIQEALEGLAETEKAWREKLGTPAAVTLEPRIELALSRLEAACEAFEDINEQGMEAAQQELFDVHRQAERVLFGALLGLLMISGGWALMLTRAISRPLAVLETDLLRLDDSDAMPERRLWWLSPAELHTLSQSLVEISQRLASTTQQRLEAMIALEAALAREHGLNAQLAASNASLDEQVRAKTVALAAANAQLVGLVEDLKLRDHSRSAFLAAVSHEFRSPLAVVKGAALTLSELGPGLKAEAVQRLHESIAEETEHLSALIEDLLDVARQDAGRFSISPEPGIEMEALVESVLGGFAPALSQQGLRIRRLMDPDLPPFTADAPRLRQVLRNLLENAAKFSPPGGTIVMEIRRFASEDGKPRLKVSVEDEGPGFPPEVGAQLFIPFRLYTPGKSGAGLGLAIARQLVEAHGGAISAENRPQGGSRFWFWLPLDA